MADATLTGSLATFSAGAVTADLGAELSGSSGAFSVGSVATAITYVLRMDFPVEPMINIDLGAIVQEGLLAVATVTQPNNVLIYYGITQTHVLVMQDSTLTGSIPGMALSQDILLAVPDVTATLSIPAMSLATWPMLAVDPVISGGSIDLGGITQNHMLQVASNTLQTLIPSFSLGLSDKCPSPKCQLEQVDQVNSWDVSTGDPDLALWASSPLFRLTIIWEQLEKRYKDWIIGYFEGNASTSFSFPYIFDGWSYNCMIESPPRVSFRNDSQLFDVNVTLIGFRESQWVV